MMKPLRSAVAAIAAMAILGLGAVIPLSAAADDASTDAKLVSLSPNPWYSNGPFGGWGTSLAWLANATGNYGEDGSVTRYSGDSSDTAAKAAAEKKAQEYGSKLREEFYRSIFGKDGLDLNMARYNIGGGNASDVAYGYPFMRQGAAVPGYWAQDADGSRGVYGGVGTKQSDKDKLDSAFDAASDDSYVWSGKNSGTDAAKAVKAQEWWLKRGAQDGDITHVEAFANSAPWFMTESGYATGGTDSSSNNLKDSAKFAQYLAKVVAHLNTLKSDNGKSVSIDTVEPLNESETSYWGTPRTKASDYPNSTLVNRYWQRYYANTGKDKSVTPYYDGVKKPQEGMHVDSGTAQKTLTALRSALNENDLASVRVSATDATDSGQFVESYNKYSQSVRDAIGQYNTHSYGTNNQRVARDIAQADGKKMSMSEVDGSWQSGGFNPYGFDNGLGMAGKINSDVYALQSKDFTFWQVVEDLYNMSTGKTDVNGNAANPQGENTNWGTVLIDFDCTVAGTDGKLYSERAVDNNNGTTNGIKPCSVVVNSKYNAGRAYTHFIHEGDSIISNNSTGDNMTATSADGKTQTVIHRNTSSQTQKLVIDLSKYGNIADNASGKLYLTTAPKAKADTYAATMDYMNEFSNQEQSADSVVIDAAAKTATVTVPAESIASIQLSGVTGVSTDASVKDGQAYLLVGQGSGRALTVDGNGALTIEDIATEAESSRNQAFVLHEVAAGSERPTLRRYVVSTLDGSRILGKDGAFSAGNVDSAKTNPDDVWILNTEDGQNYSLVNTTAKQALDVGGGKTSAGTSVGVWQSNGGTNQAWTLRSTQSTGSQKVNVRTSVGSDAAKSLPETVVPYYTWGVGAPVSVTWDVSSVNTSVRGTYQVTGTAVDAFGNHVTLLATVTVGDFTVVDPVSITIVKGVSMESIEKALNGASVNAHVGASSAIPVNPDDVDWNLDAAKSALSSAKVGDAVTVNGTVKASSTASVPVKATVYVNAAESVNIARTAASSLTVNEQEGTSGTKAIDGDTTSKGWSTWGTTVGNPVATFSFSSPQTVSEVKTFFYRDGRASWPKQQKLEYRDTDGAWHDIGVKDGAAEGWVLQKSADDDPSVDGDAPIADFVLDEPVVATGIRLTNVLQDTGVYINVAEMQIFGNALDGSAIAQPSSDASLGDLRIDGKRIDGFDSAKDSYTVTLPADAEVNPVLQAFSTDNAAQTAIDWTQNVSRSVSGTDGQSRLGGTATITVTAADGTTTRKTTVTFVPTGVLSRIDVVPPTKTAYTVGDKFDMGGMSISAVERLGNGETRSRTISNDDPQLSITGFDSTSSGTKTIIVSYRGVSATFTVTVKAADNGDGGNSGGDGSNDGDGSHGAAVPSGDGSQDPRSNAAGFAANGSLSATGTTVVTVALASVVLLALGVMATLVLRRHGRA